jgi:hypothetical protein
MALPEAVHDKIEKQTDSSEENRHNVCAKRQDNKPQNTESYAVADRLPAFNVSGNECPLSCACHFAVDATVDVVIEHAAAAYDQRHASQKGGEAPKTKVPDIDCGQQKTGNATQVIAVNDAGFSELVVAI